MEMMETEIELKYLIVDEQVVEKITNLLDAKKYHYEFEKNELKNCYFDTKELELRKHDCGLRVRSKNGQREQTIKMSGQALAGLHKRPEYNVNIDNNTPVLSLFPKDIWPENIQLVEWQNNLMALFTTDFVRHMWTIQYQDSVIELAFDKGCISSSDRQVDICEIELELKSGIEYDLFSLAHQLMTVLLMRPGVYSKAARGYQLWHNIGPNLAIEDFPFIPVSGKDTCPSAFINGVTFCLTHLQKTIDVYFHQPSLHVLGQLNHTLQLLRHAFWLFEDFMTDDMIVIRKEISYFIKMFVWENNAKNLQELLVQSNSYRKQIEYNQKLIAQLKLEELRFPTVEHILELLQSTRFNQLQLTLLQLILRGEQGLLKPEGKNLTIFTFSMIMLEHSLVDLVVEISADKQCSAEQYLLQKQNLNRSLLTGSWCGQLYDDMARTEYRLPWLDIYNGITELETLWMLRKQLLQMQLIEEQSDKLLNWLDTKIESLLVALDSSRQVALTTSPYWRT